MEYKHILFGKDPSGKLTKEKFLARVYPELYQSILEFCNDNNLNDIKFSEKVYHYKYNINIIVTCQNPTCSNVVKFKNSTIGYYKYCSNACVSKDPAIKKLKEEKSIEKFGTKTPAESKEIKEKTIRTINSKSSEEKQAIKNKRKETNIKNWGVDNPNKVQEIVNRRVLSFKENGTWRPNFEKTMMELYDETVAQKLEWVKEKTKQTNLERYDVQNVMQNLDIQKKAFDTNEQRYGNGVTFLNQETKEKSNSTIKERFGVDNVFQNEIIKKQIVETNIKNFGVDHPMKNETIKNGMLLTLNETYLKKLKDYYKNYNLISSDSNMMVFECDLKNNHNFSISHDLLHNRHKAKTTICTICNSVNSSKSGLELQLLDFIKKNYTKEVVVNSRKIIDGLELDVYLPDLKLAFEFNGLYWHNELNKENNYHINKTEQCEKLGIHLIHIYQDDWLYKLDVVKSRILNTLGVTENKVYARNCEIKEVSYKEAKKYLEENHIQGNSVSKIRYGLYHTGDLVSLMTFTMPRRIMKSNTSVEGEYELVRFSSKKYTSVVGGASRLLKHFIKINIPTKIISYADRSWSTGNLYESLGFNFINNTPPNYYYIVDGIRKHRFNYRKDILVKEGYDSTKTEHGIMIERNIFRIYDSGSMKYEMIIKKPH